MWFHNNRMSWWRGWSKDGCYNYGDLNHFIASCLKKGKQEAGPRNHHSGRRKGKRKYTSSKHKSTRGFNKEALNKKYLQKAMIKEHAFLASLSNLDHDSNDATSSSSDEEIDRRVEDKLNRLCFLADTTGGLCTMALGDDVVDGNNEDITDDSACEVSHSANDLTVER
jgi:hypothetical protein